MFARLPIAAGVAALCVVVSGCRGVGCGSKCGDGASYAFSKYDCSCDPCCNGTYGCGSGDKSCGCNSQGSRPILGALCDCSGCGELYWNEWYNDPPALCEPCDACGNYTGAGGGYYGAPHSGHSHYAAAKPKQAKPLQLAESPEPAEEDVELVR